MNKSNPAPLPKPASITTQAPYRIRCNFDVDGVVADFDGWCLELFGAVPSNLTMELDDGTVLKGDDALWAHVNRTPEFWLEMPIFDGVAEMIELARPYGVGFLTGCPRNGYDRAEREKRLKLNRYWPDLHVSTCVSRYKIDHMQEKGDILVDDFIANIKRWEKAGGTAIYHKDHARTMDELRAALIRQFGPI